MSDDSHRILDAIGRLDQKVDRLDQKVDQLANDVTGLRVDLMARVDRLNDALGQLRDDMSVNFSNTDRVDRRAQSAHDEIRLAMEMVSGMVRSVRRLESRVSTLEEKH